MQVLLYRLTHSSPDVLASWKTILPYDYNPEMFLYGWIILERTAGAQTCSVITSDAQA